MTHPHDTSTPSMSTENVKSEDLVLVPREPTREMVDAGRIYGWDDPDHEGSCIGHPETRESIYRAMIAAAPPFSASHPAKEVEEKVVVPYDDFHAAYQFVPRSKMSPDHCLKTRLRSLLREQDLAHVDEAEALTAPTLSASHPAKEGGEAEAVERLKDAIEGECDGLAISDEQAAAILAHVALPEATAAPATQPGETVREARDYSTCTMGVGCETYGICYADAQGEPDDCCAVLSVPYPTGEAGEPASQTEGMGGKPRAVPSYAGWRSVDTAPEDEHIILSTTGGHVGEALMLMDEDTGQQKWTWASGPVSKFHEPLGWMPMPDALSKPVLSDLRSGGFDGPTGAE